MRALKALQAMSTEIKPPKKAGRNMRSFQAEKDVDRMLERANGEGVKIAFLCNKALRKLLTEMGYARKKDLAS